LSDDPRDTHVREYKLITEETKQEIIKDMETPVFVYRDAFNPDDPGMTPGPTFVSGYRGPVVLRNENWLTENRDERFPDTTNTTHHNHETSLHLHGGHNPAHADGFAEFWVLAGEARDYFYTNSAPHVIDEGCGSEEFDETWIPSTMWYHDHGMDVTGFNVSRGLAGFYLVFDEREIKLILDGVLPSPGRDALECLGIRTETIDGLLGTDGKNDAGFDFGLALQDQKFELVDGELRLAYDFLDHAGRLGDVFTVNGRAQPYFKVQPRKYRFRILNASNARHYQLRLSSGKPFIVFGADTWLFPVAGAAYDVELSMGQRHDVIVDFSAYDSGDEVFLENIMIQEDGRKGKEVDPDRPTPLLKFIVGDELVTPDITKIAAGTTIRGFVDVPIDPDDPDGPDGQWAPIREDEIVKDGIGSIENPRVFGFDRGGGVWTVNNRFFNPRRADAVPALDTAECWIFENGGGGWWHPIHTHLEGFQVQTLDGETPLFERSFNSDLVNLHGGEEAKVFIKFRTFTGPFNFHCHAVEHEDMRMMANHDPRPDGAAGPESPLNGELPIDPQVSGVVGVDDDVDVCSEIEHAELLYFDVAGDVEPLDGRGVGGPGCVFDIDKRGND
jgi:FtsP/CotA-like multicopper oxidase with cupredoxin domain